MSHTFPTIRWIVDRRPTVCPVGDQGARGTCLAWAATTSHEQLVSQSLSAEYLHWASNTPPGARGTIAGLVSALDNRGQPPAAQWPYDQKLDESAATYQPLPSVSGPFSKSTVRLADESPSGLVRELSRDRLPVAILRVTQSFLMAPGGIVDGLDTGTDGHAVAVVGVAEMLAAVGSIPSGARLICVQNSWGPTWGVAGYGLVTEAAWTASVLFAVVLE